MPFITSSPTLLLEEKGVVTPLSLEEGLGGEVTLSSLVEGYSSFSAQINFGWGEAKTRRLRLLSLT